MPLSPGAWRFRFFSALFHYPLPQGLDFFIPIDLIIAEGSKAVWEKSDLQLDGSTVTMVRGRLKENSPKVFGSVIPFLIKWLYMFCKSLF